MSQQLTIQKSTLWICLPQRREIGTKISQQVHPIAKPQIAKNQSSLLFCAGCQSVKQWQNSNDSSVSI